MQQVNLGMIGGGTVGSGVYHALEQNGDLMASRLGLQINILRIAVKALNEPRPYAIPESLMTTDWAAVVKDPKVDVVIELAGGTTVARAMVLSALESGKPVITANKALLSAYGEELFEAARKNKANLYYEASVAGGIPIIKSLREGFIGNRITHLYGIVNGTCNYILTRMKLEGAEFETVLDEAQRLGYAEADPSLDVDGYDSLHKIGILASLAHGFWVNPRDIYVEGIRQVTQADIRFANQLGYTIKLLGIIKRIPDRVGANNNGSHVQVSVYPVLVPHSHVLANVNNVFNAVFVRGDLVGDTLFYGRGAGKDATASAVLSDIADAALDLKFDTKCRVPPFVPHEKQGAVLPIDAAVSRYYVRMHVVDQPGVLASVAALFAENHIGISSVFQPEGHEGQGVPLVVMTHEAPNAAMHSALAKIRQLPVSLAEPRMIRVEDFE
ncbi:MAG TPA: homoserine dehydrogenase [Candidatus Paceibacterota bacterium]|nr:homoserine dehydrogenase [Verrucomicrobiota bacterium]HRY48445.1 homoserine dehydrogenase [Candidatus Paceibacterota bacterium]HRZ99625.1 homoserine dehydrogenase [Candidatus Paceibacterota bacterium]